MAYIKSIEINDFRGIRKLAISDLSNINLVVGDNNSGKTTFLEAIQLLYAEPSLGSIMNVISQRTLLRPDLTSFYTSFIKMFNKAQAKEQLGFDIYATGRREALEFELSGNERIIAGDEAFKISSISPSQKTHMKRTLKGIPETAKLFSGRVVAGREHNAVDTKIRITSLDDGTTTPTKGKSVYYLPSFGHLRFDLLQNIVNNPDYKKLAINILKQFDDSIEDICFTKTDDGAYLETVITNNNVIMPFSVYGDGIKKILYILNKLFEASDSILMIDEIETGLHKKYYDMLFPVIFALANKLSVQLFIATHSIEAIEAILKYGDYDKNDKRDSDDPIRVITLRKIQSDGERSNIVARNVSGKYVYENRKVFEFEVRL